METAVLVFIAIIFGLASVFYWIFLVKTGSEGVPWAKRLLLAGTGFLVLERMAGLVLHREAMFDPAQSTIWYALLLSGLFSVLSFARNVDAFGALVGPWVFVHLMAHIAFAGVKHGATEQYNFLTNAWYPIHLGLFVGAEVTLLLSALSALFYLIQARRLKLKKIDELQKIPSLNVLESMFGQFWLMATFLFTLGIPAAGALAKHQWGSYWSWDPKQIWALCVWLILVVGWQLRTLFSIYGRRLALLVSILGFGLAASFVIVDKASPTRHLGDYQ